MAKYCKKCGIENKEDSIFCRACGERLSGIHSKSDNDSGFASGNNKILIGVIVLLLIVVAIIGTYAYVTMSDNDSDTNGDDSIGKISDSSVSDVSSVNTKSWHKVDSFSGVGDKTITLNYEGNRIRVTSSAMPLKNHADNFMYTTVTKNGYTVGSSDLSWNSTNAVATKSDSIEFTEPGTYYIYVSTYELQYWNLEMYEYY